MSGPSTQEISLEMSELQMALVAYGKDQARLVSRNPKMVKATFDILKAVAENKPLAGATAIAGATSAGTRMVGASAAVRDGAKYASFSASSFKASMDLANLARLTSPMAVVAYTSAALMHKTGMAVSLAGGNNEQAACIGAIMELAGSATTTALLVPTGIGAVLAAAALSASVWNAHLACGGANPFE